MPLRCSCGALLPEDARFCHKCGKPQYEEDIARLNELEAQARPILPPPPPPQVLVSPGNLSMGRAVVISLAVAVMAFLVLTVIPKVGPAMMVTFMASGFASVRLYSARSTSPLNPLSAACLGAMPWWWLSIPLALCAAALQSPAVQEALKQANQPEITNNLALLKDPTVMLVGLIEAFFTCTVFGALGGLLAARWRPRNGPSH